MALVRIAAGLLALPAVLIAIFAAAYYHLVGAPPSREEQQFRSRAAAAEGPVIDAGALLPGSWQRICTVPAGTATETLRNLTGSRLDSPAWLANGLHSALIYVAAADPVAVRLPESGPVALARPVAACMPPGRAQFRLEQRGTIVTLHAAPVEGRSLLALDLDGNGVTLAPLAGSRVFFDSDDDGLAEKTAWVAAPDAVLAVDRNGDGRILAAAELVAGHDDSAFAALAALDGNRDGRLDAADPAFASLRAWVDRDGDGLGAGAELLPLAAAGVTALTIDSRPRHETTAAATVVRRGTLVLSNGREAALDEILPRRAANYLLPPALRGALPSHTVPPETPAHIAMPGEGWLPPLPVAISRDPALARLIDDFVTRRPAIPDAALLDSHRRVHDILLRWAGLHDIAGRSADELKIIWVLANEGPYWEGQGADGADWMLKPELLEGWAWRFDAMLARLLGQGPYAATPLAGRQIHAPGDSLGAAAFWALWVPSLDLAWRGADQAALRTALEETFGLTGARPHWARLRAFWEADRGITGSSGPDLLSPWRNGARLDGGDGDDLYLIGPGVGAVHISDSGGNDALVTTSEVDAAAIAVGREHQDLVLTFLPAGETVTVAGHYAGRPVERLRLGDGTVVDLAPQY